MVIGSGEYMKYLFSITNVYTGILYRTNVFIVEVEYEEFMLATTNAQDAGEASAARNLGRVCVYAHVVMVSHSHG